METPAAAVDTKKDSSLKKPAIVAVKEEVKKTKKVKEEKERSDFRRLEVETSFGYAKTFRTLSSKDPNDILAGFKLQMQLFG